MADLASLSPEDITTLRMAMELTGAAAVPETEVNACGHKKAHAVAGVKLAFTSEIAKKVHDWLVANLPKVINAAIAGAHRNKATSKVSTDLLALLPQMEKELSLGSFEALVLLLQHLMGYPPGFTDKDAAGSHVIPVNTDDDTPQSLPPFPIGSEFRTIKGKIIPWMAAQIADSYGFCLDSAKLRGTALTATTCAGPKGKPVGLYDRTLFLDIVLKNTSSARGADGSRPARHTMGAAAGAGGP
jgi:hypothetical protein